MTRYLVALSLGPVQSMIGAARRTRDLWCGSWLLSEAARAAARVLHESHPGCLIFPVSGQPEDLKPQEQPKGTANISNILRAEVSAPDAEAVRALCVAAKKAATDRLVELGESARRGVPVRQDVWQAQIDDILECYAAWTPCEDGYTAASHRLAATLAARKATRDFGPSRLPATEGLPKSSLDGAFETVLPKVPKRDSVRKKLGLADNEQLDALGVMKRLAGQVEQFTAYSRVAADPWIESKSITPEQRCELREAYEPLVGMQLATRVSGNDGAYGAFPYDAQLLYSSRLEHELVTAGEGERKSLVALRGCLRSIGASAGKPVPYAAILKADGDRMGQFLAKACSADQSRDISKALHDFASQVRKIVRHHRGHAIYAGGDDVLALVPLTQSMACAAALAEQFKTSLASVSDEMRVGEAERPTLSVGLGIGHFMQPLGALRARAEEAEKLAKGDDTNRPRNALAIVLGIRSGGEHKVRLKWSNIAALEDLKAIVEAFREGLLPSHIAYDLRGIDQRLAWLRNDDGHEAKGMQLAEVRRLLDRARTDKGDKVAQRERELVERRIDKQRLADVADLLIVARWLAAKTAAEVGER